MTGGTTSTIQEATTPGASAPVASALQQAPFIHPGLGQRGRTDLTTVGATIAMPIFRLRIPTSLLVLALAIACFFLALLVTPPASIVVVATGCAVLAAVLLARRRCR